jgi:hypothetical protein
LTNQSIKTVQKPPLLTNLKTAFGPCGAKLLK